MKDCGPERLEVADPKGHGIQGGEVSDQITHSNHHPEEHNNEHERFDNDHLIFNLFFLCFHG